MPGMMMYQYQEIPSYAFCLHDVEDEMFLPSQANNTDTGYDVRSAINVDINPKTFVKIPLGIRVAAPSGWWLEIRPRSSTFIKRHLLALYGVIDQDFHDQLCFLAYNPSDTDIVHVSYGDRVGQLVPVKRQVMKVENVPVDVFEDIVKMKNAARQGGFGSTGES